MIATVPTATYRLQLREGVDLAQAAALVPYLAELGIGHLYLSPIFAAYDGSTHGYDVIDPARIDDAIGGRAGFDALLDALARAGMGVLLDIVPNHMRAHADNPWWRDVLEHGVASRHAAFFDLQWSSDPERRLVLPVLGTHYGDALDRGELIPGRDRDGFVVRYHDLRAPLDPRTWPVILDRAATRLRGPACDVIAELSIACASLPPRTTDARKERAQRSAAVHERLRAALRTPELAAAIDAALGELAGRPDDPASTAALHELLDAQPWRLAFWRSGLGEINYRRFFDISELVALRSEDPVVFAASHALVGELVRTSPVPVGLRIDHVDGLADPRGYLARLRELGARWIVVEKILGDGETLRASWDTDGTTGYEVASLLSRSAIDPAGARLLHAAWRRRNGDVELDRAAHAAKLQVLDGSFATTLRWLAEDLRRLTSSDRRARDVSLPELERALRELTAALPVYRTYLDARGGEDGDRTLLDTALQRAGERLPAEEQLALAFVGRVLQGEPDWTEDRALEVAAFVRRWQQLTAPLAAKGVEDTLLYRWTALGALAEVGAPLSLPRDPVAELVHGLQARQRSQRAPLVATSTHDTKRGEDARARLGVISQLAERWLAVADEAAEALAEVGGVPGDRDELELLLQAFVAIRPADDISNDELAPRLHAYATKAMREAKRHTDWLRPDEAYEASMHARVDALLAGAATTGWGRRLLTLQRRIAFFGAHDALAQRLLALAAPGVCDIYQGTELWDLSLVDPDNRRPVDFEARAQLLRALARADIRELREHWADGRIKALVLWRGLRARRDHPALFLGGEVSPLEIVGGRSQHIVGFARRTPDGACALAVAARLTTRLVEPPQWPTGAVWSGALRVPADILRWRDAITGAVWTAVDDHIALSSVLAELPVALLVGER